MRYLVALNEHKHFSRAALACNITQPALSNALKALEVDFGVVIIKRGRTYAGLTPEGERVLATAQRMLHEHKLLQQELVSQQHKPVGTLRMGAVPTAMPILARFAATLQARYEGIRPVVLSLSSTELETGLDNLSIDLALGYTDRMGLQSTKLNAWPQYIEHYFFCCAVRPCLMPVRCKWARAWIGARQLACRCVCSHPRCTTARLWTLPLSPPGLRCGL
jgi:DNA-binding transcriptional LysR family regulator